MYRVREYLYIAWEPYGGGQVGPVPHLTCCCVWYHSSCRIVCFSYDEKGSVNDVLLLQPLWHDCELLLHQNLLLEVI